MVLLSGYLIYKIVLKNNLSKKIALRAAAISDSKNKDYQVVVRLINKNVDINFIQHYGEKLSLVGAIKSSINKIMSIFGTQAIVLITPMILWGMFLW